jgi:hypothetical protein
MKINRFFAVLLLALVISGCGDKPAKVTASSQHESYGPEGLLEAREPGWHSASPPQYPQFLQIDLAKKEEISYIAFLPQKGFDARLPKAIRIDASEDGKSWHAIAGSDNMCEINTNDGWVNLPFDKPRKINFLKIIIFSNCDGGTWLTLRGVRYGK